MSKCGVALPAGGRERSVEIICCQLLCETSVYRVLFVCALERVFVGLDLYTCQERQIYTHIEGTSVCVWERCCGASSSLSFFLALSRIFIEWVITHCRSLSYFY